MFLKFWHTAINCILCFNLGPNYLNLFTVSGWLSAYVPWPGVISQQHGDHYPPSTSSPHRSSTRFVPYSKRAHQRVCGQWKWTGPRKRECAGVSGRHGVRSGQTWHASLRCARGGVFSSDIVDKRLLIQWETRTMYGSMAICQKIFIWNFFFYKSVHNFFLLGRTRPY
jgi:hypothetical protein